MEFARSILNALIEGLLSPFEGRDPAFSLIPLSILLGITFLWIFGRVSNQQAILRAKRRVQAHLYELRLFVDEPKIILRAQAALLRENFRYLGLMLVPAAVVGVPLVLLLALLDSFYGRSPLAPGRASIVTVALGAPLALSDPAPVLELPDGIVAETPAVRVMADNQVSWRIRPLRQVSGMLRVTAGGESAAKSIEAGRGPSYISPRRVSSAWEGLQYPHELLLNTHAIKSIEIDYPSSEVQWFGARLHWIWWLVIVSMAAAFLLRRRFHVVF